MHLSWILSSRKKQTVADIKKALEEKGIDYPSKATKEELLALLAE
ncbi:TPA: HeH/LEM domain-containing protein [Streptococcus pyogenes]